MSATIKKGMVLVSWILSYFGAFCVARIFYSIHIHYEKDCLKEIKKPMIIVSNHKKPFDPWIIIPAIPFFSFLKLLPIRPFAKKKFPKRAYILRFLSALGVVRFVYYIYDAISIPDTESFEEKIHPLVETLQNNNSILMFPEGGIFFNEGIGVFKKGIVVIQERTDVPILPCAVRYGEKGIFRRKVRVSFGETVYIPEELLKNEDDYSEARECLRQNVFRLYKNS